MPQPRMPLVVDDEGQQCKHMLVFGGIGSKVWNSKSSCVLVFLRFCEGMSHDIMRCMLSMVQVMLTVRTCLTMFFSMSSTLSSSR